MKYIKSSHGFMFILFLFILNYSVGQTNEGSKQEASVKLSVKPSNKTGVFIIVKSIGVRAFNVPKEQFLSVGYKDDEQADCYFEVKEINGEKEIYLEPTADYQSLPVLKKHEASKCLILTHNHSISYYFDLALYYKFVPSKSYKMRVIFRLAQYNKLKNIESEWIKI